MATVTVTQPAYGHTSTRNSSMSGYTVQWYDDSGASFNGFRVICHACEGTLYRSSSNPATFDLSSLEDSGHPGPFEIVTDAGSPPPAEAWLAVHTYAVDAKGTTSPAYREYITTSGGTVKITIDATPNAGYRFKEWRRDSPTGTVESTDSHYQKTFRLYGSGSHTVCYFAIFEDTSLIPVAASFKYPVNYPGTGSVVVEGVRYYWGRVASSPTSNTVMAYYQNTGPGGGDIRIGIANLTTSPAYKGADTGVIYPGQTLSINHSVTNAPVYEGFGLQVDRVEVTESGFFGGSERRETRTYTYGGGSGSVSLSHVVSADLAGDVENSVVNVVVYLVFAYNYRQVVFTVVGDDLSRPYLRVSAGVNAGTAFAEPGTHSVSMWVLDSYYDSYSDGKVEFGGYLARDRAFVHGWSVPVSGTGNNRYLIIHNVPAGTVIYVTVYICTHLLVCTDDGLYLECKPPELLYDCSVPPGTTVYD